MKKALFILVGSAILFAGCAASSGGSGTTKERMRAIEVPTEKVFSATASYLRERGYDLVKMDEASGLIETAYKTGAGWGVGPPSDKRCRVVARVKPGETSGAVVMLELLSEEKDTYAGWQTVDMAISREMIYYKRYLEGIVARAEGRSIN